MGRSRIVNNSIQGLFYRNNVLVSLSVYVNIAKKKNQYSEFQGCLFDVDESIKIYLAAYCF